MRAGEDNERQVGREWHTCIVLLLQWPVEEPCVFNDDGEPLTRLQLNIKTWSKISKMSIDHLFQDFSTIAGICQADKYMLSASAKLTGDMAITGSNIEVYLDRNGHLTCNSLGGGIFPVPAVSLLHLIQQEEREGQR